MKTIELSVKDRVLLPGIFAFNKDSFTEAAVQRSIRELIAIAKPEAEAINFKTVQGGAVWDSRAGVDKDFELTPVQVGYLKETIYTLSRAGGVTQDLLPICEKLNGL